MREGRCRVWRQETKEVEEVEELEEVEEAKELEGENWAVYGGIWGCRMRVWTKKNW